MRISDWSSDVCSSDLIRVQRHCPQLAAGKQRREQPPLQREALPVPGREMPGLQQAEAGIDPARLLALALFPEASDPVVAAKFDLTIPADIRLRSEEHTSELQSLMRNSYAVLCLKKKKQTQNNK